MECNEPLADFLPHVTPYVFSNRELIFEGHPTNFYLVIEGRVALYRAPSAKQRHVKDKLLLDIYGPGEFFGEACFSSNDPSYRAEAMGTAKVMLWDKAFVLKREVFLPALLDFLALRHSAAIARIEMMHAAGIAHRVIPALIHFARKFGSETADYYEIAGLTQETISQYIGTSREIVTHQCNLLRRKGALSYSRKEIRIYKVAERERATA